MNKEKEQEPEPVLQEEKKEEIHPEKEDETLQILSSELEELKKKGEEFEQKYWLLLAETENSRKRMVKERDGDRRYAVQGVILDLLHPIDQMEKALGHSDQASADVQNWAVGFKMILSQFKDALTSHSVHPFHAKGQKFDPHLHEAVEMVETDQVEPDTVVEELSQGYMIGEKVLRPARVKVAKLVSVEENKDEQKQSGGIHDKEEK